MAIQFTNSTDGLEQSDPLPMDADFTWMGWFIPLTEKPGALEYRPYWTLHDAGYTNYVAIESAFEGQNIDVYGYDGAVFESESAGLHTALLGTAYHIALTYDISETRLKYYINGTLILNTTVVNFTGFTSAKEYIAYDGFGGFNKFAVQNLMAWAGVILTEDQIQLQMASSTALIAGGLYYDTPLTNASDLADVSGNGRNWINVGAGGTDYILYDVKFISGNGNQTEGGALVIPYLPYKLVQNAKDTLARNLWYSINAIAAYNVIGIFPYAPNATYRPIIEPYTGGSPIEQGITATNIPFQFPVDGGTNYKILAAPFATNPDNATLFLQFDYIGNAAILAGDIADPDDADGFPLALIRQNPEQTYENVVTFKHPFPAGEQGDILTSGVSLMGDAFNNEDLFGFDTEIDQIFQISSLPVTGKAVRTNNGENLFYVGVVPSAPNPPVIYTVDASGNLGGTSWTLTGVNLFALAASNDGSILYYSSNTGGGGTGAVKRWDLINDVALSDFKAAVTNYLVPDILVLSDDTIIVSYFKSSVTRDFLIRRFDAAGTLLNTYNFGSDHTGTTPRSGYSLNDPNSFWTWTHSAVNVGFQTYHEVDVATGTDLEAIICMTFEEGLYQGTETPTPVARFGNSFSCPIYQLREGIEPPPIVTNPLSGIYKIIPRSRKTNDTLYTSLDPIETEDVKIPRPFGKSGLLGQ